MYCYPRHPRYRRGVGGEGGVSHPRTLDALVGGLGCSGDDRPVTGATPPPCEGRTRRRPNSRAIGGLGAKCAFLHQPRRRGLAQIGTIGTGEGGEGEVVEPWHRPLPCTRFHLRFRGGRVYCYTRHRSGAGRGNCASDAECGLLEPKIFCLLEVTNDNGVAIFRQDPNQSAYRSTRLPTSNYRHPGRFQAARDGM